MLCLRKCLVLGAILTEAARLPAVPVQILVSPPAPSDCAAVVKKMLHRKLRFPDPNRQAELYIKPIAQMALRGSRGLLLSPTDFFDRLGASLPSDPMLLSALRVLRTANERPGFISCVLGHNCLFVEPPGAEHTGARLSAHHATLGGSLEWESFAPGVGPDPRSLSHLQWRAPEYVGIIVQPPEAEAHALVVDWYGDWVHEAAHVVVLDEVGEWLRAVKKLAARGQLRDDGGLSYLKIRDGKQVLDAAFFFLLSEGSAHQTDLLVQQSFQVSADAIPSALEIQAHLLSEIETLRPGASSDLGLSAPTDVFIRANALRESMRETVRLSNSE